MYRIEKAVVGLSAVDVAMLFFGAVAVFSHAHSSTYKGRKISERHVSLRSDGRWSNETSIMVGCAVEGPSQYYYTEKFGPFQMETVALEY